MPRYICARLFIALCESDTHHEWKGTFLSMEKEGSEFISRVKRFGTEPRDAFLTHGSLNSRTLK